MLQATPAGEFLAVAARAPDHPALVHDGTPTTYGALRDAAEAVAAGLGDRPGIVGVPATRTPETIAALLGVWLAGGAYCPLDPSFPAERLAAMRGVCDRVLGGPGAPGAPVGGEAPACPARASRPGGPGGRPRRR